MGKIIDDADNIIAHCQHVLGEKGRLHTAIAGFISREEQIRLATAVARAMTDKTSLVAEAGTGTGKTFAYLLPCLLSGKKTIISTATKTLQDQLFYKDLPLLIQALGLSTRVQNLKGRANYLCRYRIELHTLEGAALPSGVQGELRYIQEKLPQFVGGERSELPEIDENAGVWPYATSSVDNCLGTDCPYHNECFLIKARRRALEVDLVVINHHLFFADSELKETGFGELLPSAEVLIFDEAHQLLDIATHFSGERFSTKQLTEWLDDLIKEWPTLDLANQPFKQWRFTLEGLIQQFIHDFPVNEERCVWQKLERQAAFRDAWQDLHTLLIEIEQLLLQTDNEHTGLSRSKKRLQSLQETLGYFTQTGPAFIKWVERFKQSLVFHATPFDTALFFKKRLANVPCSTIFTSATLTMADSFAPFIKSLGLEKVQTLLLASPFDYQKQALLYLPRRLPDPKDADYYEALLAKALPIINACNGRCFFLFTSHRALKQVAMKLKDTLNFPLLIQGEEAKPILLARFRQLGNAVLLGTSTFWEGVDVKGDALSCVIIDKLPFASPVDPVMCGKMAHLKSQGLSAFDELSLPNAILALKQGVGRLIRDCEDRGVLMIADPRLTGRAYGRAIFKSLPPLKKTRDEKRVLQFIDQLVLNHEPVSD